MVTLPNGKPVLLYDGVCNLCRGSVLFVIRHDPKACFQFASQQSRVGQELLAAYDMNNEPALSSVYLVDEAGIHGKSTAALRTLKRLKAPWPVLYGLIVIPRFIRDFAYDFVGKRRYRWFGRMAACWIPQGPEKQRFLDA